MLEIQNVSKTFNAGTVNEKTALNGLNLKLNEGDFVTVIGGNGAGKSTMLNAVAGVWGVDSGTITIGGNNVTNLPEYKRAQFIGRVFQDPMMGTAATMQIEENLALAASFTALGEVPDYNTAFMNLESGVDDAIAVDIGVANYQLKTRDSSKFVMLEKPLSTEQYGIGFKKGNTELADQVKATLDEMWADGTFTKIATAAAENYDAPELADMICYGN